MTMNDINVFMISNMHLYVNFQLHPTRIVLHYYFHMLSWDLPTPPPNPYKTSFPILTHICYALRILYRQWICQIIQ